MLTIHSYLSRDASTAANLTYVNTAGNAIIKVSVCRAA